MVDDRPEGDHRDVQVPTAARIVFKAIGVLAALGLAFVAVVAFGLIRQAHDFRQIAQSNKSAATAQASAKAQAFFRDLVATAKTAVPTQNQVRALSRSHGIAAGSPLIKGGSVVVMIAAQQGYTIPQYFEGGDGTVQLCYRAAVPIAPATTPAPTLQQTACPPGPGAFGLFGTSGQRRVSSLMCHGRIPPMVEV